MMTDRIAVSLAIPAGWIEVPPGNATQRRFLQFGDPPVRRPGGIATVSVFPRGEATPSATAEEARTHTDHLISREVQQVDWDGVDVVEVIDVLTSKRDKTISRGYMAMIFTSDQYIVQWILRTRDSRTIPTADEIGRTVARSITLEEVAA